MRNKVIQNGSNKSNFVSIPCFSINPASQEYFDAANGLIGRGQMGQMNFFFLQFSMLINMAINVTTSVTLVWNKE